MKRIPIAAAKRIAVDYKQRQVVLVTWDGEGTTHIATYGTTREGCKQAASGGEVIARALGLISPVVTLPQDEKCRHGKYEGDVCHGCPEMVAVL